MFKKFIISSDLHIQNFSEININNFKRDLKNISWESVLANNNPDSAFNLFKEDFLTLFNLNFPTITKKFNKNIHKIEKWLTKGLLISRNNKIKLCKKSISDPTDNNINLYKTYRNIYNRLLRISKKELF